MYIDGVKGSLKAQAAARLTHVYIWEKILCTAWSVARDKCTAGRALC